MKKEVDFSLLTNEELLGERKKRKNSFMSFNIMLLVLIGVSVANYFAGTQVIFTILPVCFLPIGIYNWKRLQVAEAEVKKRGLQ
jgi:hypothetical protein